MPGKSSTHQTGHPDGSACAPPQDGIEVPLDVVQVFSSSSSSSCALVALSALAALAAAASALQLVHLAFHILRWAGKMFL